MVVYCIIFVFFVVDVVVIDLYGSVFQGFLLFLGFDVVVCNYVCNYFNVEQYDCVGDVLVYGCVYDVGQEEDKDKGFDLFNYVFCF